MMDIVHSALQFPMVIMLYALGFLMIATSRRVIAGIMVRPSAAMMMCLGGFFLFFAIRQTYWHIYWVARVFDRQVMMAWLLDWPVLPIVANIGSLAFGAAAIAVAGGWYIGRAAPPIVGGSVLALIVIGATLAGVRL